MKCYIMVGIPGSGKSTEAGKIAKKENAVVVSSDTIRGEIFGDESNQSNPERVFAIVDERVFKAISEGRNVIVDAANISSFYRRQWVTKLKPFGAEMIAVHLDTPIALCIERQNIRQRKVPVDVIRRMQRQFQVPTAKEGWDEIITIRPDRNGE